MEYEIRKAAARYAVEEAQAGPREVWDRLARMFVERHASWLRSYPHLELRTDPPVRTGSEYEVEGTGGGRYPMMVTEWNPGALRLAWRIGPDPGPRKDRGPAFLGGTYGFRISSEGNHVIIDAEYAEHIAVSHRGRASRSFESDPITTLQWLMSGLPVHGKLVFVLPA